MSSDHIIKDRQSICSPDNEAALLLLGLFDMKESDRNDQGSTVGPDGQENNCPRAITSSDCTKQAEEQSISQVSMDSFPQSSDRISKPQAVAKTPGATIHKSPIFHPRKRKRTSVHDFNLIVSQGMESPIPQTTMESLSAVEAAKGSSSNAQPSLPHFMGFDNQLYRCVCGTTIEPEEGMSIQCEGCLAWQHAGCFGLSGPDLEGDLYLCQLCHKERARTVDKDYVEYIRRLAGPLQGDVRARGIELVDTANTTTGNRDPKRARPGGMSRGKGRPRPAGTQPRLSEDVSEETSLHTGEILETSYTPRAIRKKSGTNVRIMRGKNAAAIVAPSATVDRDNPKVETHISEPGGTDAYTYMQPLGYVSISNNILRDHELWDMLSRLRMDTSLQDTQTQGFGPGHLPRVTLNLLDPPYPLDMRFRSTHPLPSIAVRAVRNDLVQESSPLLADYAVFASRTIEAGSFICQYLGEVYSSETYEMNRANQYSVLGLPKKFVRRLGPPLDIVLDSRNFGSDSRWIRSSCHPNAVIRPVQFDHISQSSLPLAFEVFSLMDIQEGAEITLAWEWDDQHIAHELVDLGLRDAQQSSSRLNIVLNHLSRAFYTCACSTTTNCAWSRMRSLTSCTDARNGGDDLGEIVDLGPLIGATRNWRPVSNEFPDLLDLSDSTNETSIHSIYPERPPIDSIFDEYVHIVGAQSDCQDDRSCSSLDAPSGYIPVLDITSEHSTKHFSQDSAMSIADQQDMPSEDADETMSNGSTLTEPLSVAMVDDDPEETLASPPVLEVSKQDRRAPSSPFASQPSTARKVSLTQDQHPAQSLLTGPADSVIATQLLQEPPEQDFLPVLNDICSATNVSSTGHVSGSAEAVSQLAKKRRIDLTAFMQDDVSQKGSDTGEGLDSRATRPLEALSVTTILPFERFDESTIGDSHQSANIPPGSDTPWWQIPVESSSSGYEYRRIVRKAGDESSVSRKQTDHRRLD